MPRLASQKRRLTSTGSCSSECPPEHAPEAGTSEPRFRYVFADCTCACAAKPALLRHLKAAHSLCAALDDVVTQACEKYGWGQCQRCHTFAALETEALSARMALSTVHRRPPARQAGSRRVAQQRRRPSVPHQRQPPSPRAASDSSTVEGPAPAAASTAAQQVPPKSSDLHVAPGSLADDVPQRAWTVFGNTVGSLLSRVIPTTATTLTKATGSLFCLPNDTLSDRKASSGRDRRVRARCAWIQAGEPLEPTPPAPPRPSSCTPDPDKA